MYSMSNTGKHPAVKMLHDTNKALSKLKSKKSALKSPNLGNLRNMRFLVYIDATYATWISLGCYYYVYSRRLCQLGLDRLIKFIDIWKHSH